MQRQKLKPSLPRQVKIVQKSQYEIAQSYQDKCQPLRTHVLAKMQSAQNTIKPSQVGFLAKRIDESQLMRKIEQNNKEISQLKVQKSPKDSSCLIEQKYDIQPLNLGKQNTNLTDKNDNQNKFKNDQKNDNKFKRLSKSTHEIDINEISQNSKVKNIFDNAKIYQAFSKDEEIGPGFTKQGQIIPYSIVGKPEWYLKEMIKENENHKTSQDSECSDQTQQRNNDILNDLIRAKNSSISKHHKQTTIKINEKGEQNGEITKMSKTHIYPLPWFKQEDKTFISDIKFMKKKKKLEEEQNLNGERNMYCEKELTEEQVKMKILQEECRLLQNQQNKIEKNKALLEGLTFDEKMQLTKQERTLNKFFKQENQFDQLVFKQAIQLQREPDQSILLTGDQYRKKIETTNAFEILMPFDKKYGDNYWQKMLREYPEQAIEQNATRPEWYPNDKNERKKQDNLEIIHKKRSLSMVVKDKKQNTLNGTFTTFKSGSFAQNKLNESQNQWNYELIKHIQEQNYEQQKSIELSGINKFQQEKESILNQPNNSRLVYLQNYPEGKQKINQEIENDLTYDRYNVNQKDNNSFVSSRRSRINSASDFRNGKITFQTKFLKKYNLNDDYSKDNDQVNGKSLIKNDPHYEIGSDHGSFIQINSQFLDELKDKKQQNQLEFEENNILGEEVLHSDWQDRQQLTKTGQFILKKVQLQY